MWQLSNVGSTMYFSLFTLHNDLGLLVNALIFQDEPSST